MDLYYIKKNPENSDTSPVLDLYSLKHSLYKPIATINSTDMKIPDTNSLTM